ncbi:DUF998 domain-containing protein [Actinomadura citrea]|uniref:DUF998 domain-containing protein n=1 Tax=Actinomadura citrea TaxID=46158 RepID=UPI002E2DCF60|nr:DUF998 domain-containing protein [Actinomadura citrea]
MVSRSGTRPRGSGKTPSTRRFHGHHHRRRRPFGPGRPPDVPRADRRRALPVLVAIFGVGLVAAGLLPMDPENGFPAGTPEGPVSRMSWHGVAHSVAAAVAFTALAIAAVVMTVRCVRRRAVRPAVLNGAAALVLLVPMSPDRMSLQIALNGLVAFTWTTVVALVLRRRDIHPG